MMFRSTGFWCGILVLPILFAFVFVGSSRMVFAQSCSAGQTCAGFNSTSYPSACLTVPNHSAGKSFCLPQHSSISVSCDGSCSYDVCADGGSSGLCSPALPQSCSATSVPLDSTCPVDNFWSASGNCCVNVPQPPPDDDDDDDDGPPPQCGDQCATGYVGSDGSTVETSYTPSVCGSLLTCASWHCGPDIGDSCIKACWDGALCSADDDDDDPVNYPICGVVVGSDGALLPDVAVSLSREDSGGSPSAVVTTGDSGFFTSPDGFVLSDESAIYSVHAQGSSGNPNSNAPAGYQLPPKTTNNTSSWDTNSNSQTSLNSPQYAGQEQDHSNGDCAQGCSCSFVYDLGCPAGLDGTGLSFVGQCGRGHGGSALTGTFTWEQVDSAFDYVLRVDRLDGENPEWGSSHDWFQIVPNTAPHCNGTTCSYTIPPPFASDEFLSGDYVGWNVTVRDSAATNYCRSNAPAFTIDGCTQTLTGNVYKYDESSGSCTGGGAFIRDDVLPTSNIREGFRSGGTGTPINGRLAIPPTTWYANNDGTYEIELPIGVTGDMCVSGTNLLTADPGLSYKLACVNGTEVLVDGVPTSTCEPDVTVVSGTAPNVDFSYVLTNAFENGWFQVVNGDVYGQAMSLAIPPEETLVGFKSFMSVVDDGFDATALGSIERQVGTKIAESDRYADSISGQDFWPSDFSFDSPEYAEQVSGSEFDLEAGKVYTISSGSASALLARGVYSVSGDGVAVVYVTGASNTMLFSRPFLAADSSSDNRILFIVEGDVLFSSSFGANVPTLATATHVEASVVAQGTITFDSFEELQDDTTLIVEGPIIAKGAVNFARNLGAANNLYPATIVRSNPVYLKSLVDVPGMGISDVTWSIQE